MHTAAAQKTYSANIQQQRSESFLAIYFNIFNNYNFSIEKNVIKSLLEWRERLYHNHIIYRYCKQLV